MIPTLLVGDYIVVNKFAYGLREPFSGGLLIPLGEPERGDVIVFRFPDDERLDYIKRIVGLPGDRIEIREGRLWRNGQPVDRVPDGDFRYQSPDGAQKTTRRYRELGEDGSEHSVIRSKIPSTRNNGPWEVPEGHYFMMGDNRDFSSDSRAWKRKFVAADQIKGRAVRIHWSWDVGGGSSAQRGFIEDFAVTLWRVVTFRVKEVRWQRIGRRIDGLAD